MIYLINALKYIISLFFKIISSCIARPLSILDAIGVSPWLYSSCDALRHEALQTGKRAHSLRSFPFM